MEFPFKSEYDPDRERLEILYASEVEGGRRDEQDRRDRLDDYTPVEDL